MIPNENTQSTGEVTLRYTIRDARNVEYYDQTIIASPLYWYIIIMKKEGVIMEGKEIKVLNKKITD